MLGVYPATIVSAAPELSTILNLLWVVVVIAHNSFSTAPSPPAHIASTASAMCLGKAARNPFTANGCSLLSGSSLDAA